jgi:hypothetical protein
MRHRLAEADRPRVVPIRASRAFPREDRATLSSIVDLRTAWSSCACSTQCLVGWTRDCGHRIPFASSYMLHSGAVEYLDLVLGWSIAKAGGEEGSCADTLFGFTELSQAG